MLRRVWMMTGALLGWFALILQLYLTVQLSMTNGKTLAGAIVFYLSFFTILTNLLIAALLTVLLWAPGSTVGKWFSRPMIQAGAALYIVTVGITYSLLLRHIWNPQGMQKLADVLLHDVMPILFAGYWLLFAPKQGLRWKDPVQWLVYPLIYLAYSLAAGAFSGSYPYPFIDVDLLGYPRAILNAGMMTAAFLVAGLLLVAICRRSSREIADMSS